MLRLNKKVLIGFLLLSVFATGTLSFVDTVEAAKWKKFDSGTIKFNDSDPAFKNKVSYVTYIKGSKEIKMNYYWYTAKENKKIHAGTFYFTQVGKNRIKSVIADGKGKKSKVDYIAYPYSVKQYYKSVINGLKKG